MAVFQILTFDGGGIRGAFGTALIETFEKKLGRPITDYFDLVAGTSTGAILGAGVAHGMSGKQLVDFYTQYGAEIFHPRETYKPKSWVKSIYPLVKYIFNKRTDGGKIDDFFRARFCPVALKHSFEEGFGDAQLGDLRKSRLLVSTVNLSKGQTYVFRTPHLPTAVEDRHLNIVDVLLAATAAPTYFPHKVMPDGDAYCDGALWAIDPAILAVAEAFRIRQYCSRPKCDPAYDTSTIRVLSIGTGNATYSLSPPGSDAGALYWAPRVADVMTTSQVQGLQSPLEYLLGDRYQKINFDLPDNTWTLDNTSRIPDLFETGRKVGENEFDRVAETFFIEAKLQDFVPFTHEAPTRRASASSN
ncbi:CBASS cGAMP-activated phospholipase [Pirellulales bacterium]|nr:CBASS cGAMP-activated phospholipase [Pirellulales bacterium]